MIPTHSSKAIAIGAGLSGLAAAKELRARGISVSVLEAAARTAAPWRVRQSKLRQNIYRRFARPPGHQRIRNTDTFPPRDVIFDYLGAHARELDESQSQGGLAGLQTRSCPCLCHPHQARARRDQTHRRAERPPGLGEDLARVPGVSSRRLTLYLRHFRARRGALRPPVGHWQQPQSESTSYRPGGSRRIESNWYRRSYTGRIHQILTFHNPLSPGVDHLTVRNSV